MALAAFDCPYAARALYVSPSCAATTCQCQQSRPLYVYRMDSTGEETNAVIDIVKVDLAPPHSGAGTNDNGRLWRRRPNLGQQLLDQQEVSQVVDAKLRLQPVDSRPVWRNHDARHGDEVVDLGDVAELLGGSSDVLEVGEVEF